MAQSIPDFFMKRFLPWMEREKVRASSGLSLSPVFRTLSTKRRSV